MKKKVQLLGNIDYVPQLLGCLDYYVQPSISEGFGLSVIEAMAAKIPVICTDAGGLRESVINNKTGIVVKKNDSKSSREYAIQKNNKILSVFGGKWTTSRALARNVCDKINL